MKWPFQRAGTQPEPPTAGPGTRVEANAERAAAIGGDSYAPVLTGDGARLVYLPPGAVRPPAEVEAPAGLDNLPVRPRLFVGRTTELDRLDAALAAPGGVVVQAVHGLGGIGKSTLAAHWAATRTHGCVPVRWINAYSATSVQEGLVELATALESDLPDALSPEALAERALQWLATHTGWLLILDNVNDPADIASLLARPTSGRFLITSRLATAWHNVTTIVRLDVLDEAESLDLLIRIAAHAGPWDLDGATELCAELGHLPLAIEQAAAYLAQNPRTTSRAYLALLDEYPAEMYGDGAVATPDERTIAKIWNVTLDRITALRPQAANLLRLLAWYAPDQIPATLLDGLADPPALNKAIGLRTAYSMITPDPADPHRPPTTSSTRPTPTPPPNCTPPCPPPGTTLPPGAPCSPTSTPWPPTHLPTPTPIPPRASSTAPGSSFTTRASSPARSATSDAPSKPGCGCWARTTQ